MVSAPASAPTWRITLAFVMALALALQGMLFSARSATLAASPHEVATLLCSGAEAPTPDAPHGGNRLAGLCCLAACATVAIAAPAAAGTVAAVPRTALPLAWQPVPGATVILPPTSGALGARAPPVAV